MKYLIIGQLLFALTLLVVSGCRDRAPSELTITITPVTKTIDKTRTDKVTYIYTEGTPQTYTIKKDDPLPILMGNDWRYTSWPVN